MVRVIGHHGSKLTMRVGLARRTRAELTLLGRAPGQNGKADFATFRAQMGSAEARTRSDRARKRAVNWLGPFAQSVKMHFGEPKCRAGNLRRRGRPAKWER